MTTTWALAARPVRDCWARAWKRSLTSVCWWVRCQRLTSASTSSWETLRRPSDRCGVPSTSRSMAVRIAARTGSVSASVVAGVVMRLPVLSREHGCPGRLGAGRVHSFPAVPDRRGQRVGDALLELGDLLLNRGDVAAGAGGVGAAGPAVVGV